MVHVVHMAEETAVLAPAHQAEVRLIARLWQTGAAERAPIRDEDPAPTRRGRAIRTVCSANRGRERDAAPCNARPFDRGQGGSAGAPGKGGRTSDKIHPEMTGTNRTTLRSLTPAPGSHWKPMGDGLRQAMAAYFGGAGRMPYPALAGPRGASRPDK
jgi:hypothetical protein